MAYNNRKGLLLHTLRSFEKWNKSEYNLNVIITDDGSDPNHRLEDIVNNYSFTIKVIYLDKSTKNWVSPVIPFNTGFNKIEATSDDDIVIIQNPENFHVGDVLGHAFNNLTHNDYFAYHCLALDKSDTDFVIENSILDPGLINRKLASITRVTETADNPVTPTATVTFHPVTVAGVDAQNQIGSQWYVHEKYNPRFFHFCSCLTYKNLKQLNGFDMRYAWGDAFDDDEFDHRIKNLKLNQQFISYPYVIHLWHTAYMPAVWDNWYKNQRIFNNLTKNENLIRVNNDEFGLPSNFPTTNAPITTTTNKNKTQLTKIPKIASFYWGAEHMSFLRYLTLVSFLKYNPDWEINLYVPVSVSNKISWRENNDNTHKSDNVDYTQGMCYFSKLPKEINIIPSDFESTIGNTASEAHKSDLLGWNILSNTGGLWCDMDVLFFRGINTINFDYPDADMVLCPDSRDFILNNKDILRKAYLSTLQHGKIIPSVTERFGPLENWKEFVHQPIGFLFSSPENKFYKDLLHFIYNNTSEFKNIPASYQGIGAPALRSFIIKNYKIKDYRAANTNVYNLDFDIVYKYSYHNLDNIFEKNNLPDLLNNTNSVGVHWYGGSETATKFNNLINHKNYSKLPPCTITEIIKLLNLAE